MFVGIKGGAAGLRSGRRTEGPCGGVGGVGARGLGEAGVVLVALLANFLKCASLQVVLLRVVGEAVVVVVLFQLASMSIGVMRFVRKNDVGRVMPLRQVSAGG